MGYSKEIYRATKAKMEERRTKAERRAEQVREEVYRRVPRIEELEKEISSCGILAVRAVLNGGDYILQLSHVFQDKENREYRKGYKNTRQRFFLFVGHCFNLPFVYV